VWIILFAVIGFAIAVRLREDSVRQAGGGFGAGGPGPGEAIVVGDAGLEPATFSV